MKRQKPSRLTWPKSTTHPWISPTPNAVAVAAESLLQAQADDLTDEAAAALVKSEREKNTGD